MNDLRPTRRRGAPSALLSLIALALSTLLSSAAAAQAPPDPPPRGDDAGDGDAGEVRTLDDDPNPRGVEAGLEIEGASPAQPPAPPEEDPNVAEARDRFRQGVALVQAGNCSGAIAEFEASYELVPRPNTLYNIAQCQEELNRYDLAVQAYRRYLDMAPEDDPDWPAVQATMRALEGLLGTIAVTTNVPAEVWLADRIVGESPGEVLVPGGTHMIEVRADGFMAVRREVQVAARRTAELDITLQAAEEVINIQQTTIERPPVPIGVTMGGIALTVVLAGVGGYFGSQALILQSQENQRDLRLPPNPGPIQEAAVIADVFFVSAAIVGATTIVLALLTDWSDGAPIEPEETQGTEGDGDDDGDLPADDADDVAWFLAPTGGATVGELAVGVTGGASW